MIATNVLQKKGKELAVNQKHISYLRCKKNFFLLIFFFHVKKKVNNKTQDFIKIKNTLENSIVNLILLIILVNL